MDPPYGYDNAHGVLKLLAKNGWINDESMILVEQASDDLALNSGQEKNYGSTRITKITGAELIDLYY